MYDVKTINVLLVAALLTITMAAATPDGDTNESGIGDWDGRLYINGTLASDGTALCAYVNGVENSRTTIGKFTTGMYLLSVYGNTGDNITFKVFCDSDYPAKEGAQNWAISPPRHHLNLTIDHAATVGNITDIVSNGTGTLNVTINGAVPETDSYFSDVETVNITSSNVTVTFDFNFSSASLNLSKVNISVGTSGDKSYLTIAGVNATGGQTGTKTIKLYNVSGTYNGLCVKDAEGVSYLEISSDCTGSDETKLKCDGVAVNGKTCIQSGTTLTVSGLAHSAVMQYSVPTTTTNNYVSSSGGVISSTASPTPTVTATPTATPVASIAPTPVTVSTTPIQETPTATPSGQTATAAPTVAATATPTLTTSTTDGNSPILILMVVLIIGIAAYFFIYKKAN